MFFFVPFFVFSEEEHHAEKLEVVQRSLKHTSIVFRAIHKSGVWLGHSLAKTAATSGWNMTATKRD